MEIILQGEEAENYLKERIEGQNAETLIHKLIKIPTRIQTLGHSVMYVYELKGDIICTLTRRVKDNG